MCQTLYNCFETSQFARRTALTSVERFNRTTCLVAVECACYCAAMRTTSDATSGVAAGDEVFFVPLGATMPRAVASACNILWHCNATTVDDEYDATRVCVVPRRLDNAHWSLAAVCAATPTTECAFDSVGQLRTLLQVVDCSGAQKPSLLPLVAESRIAAHATMHRNCFAAVDLLLNPNLLRTLLHSCVSVHMVPRLASTVVHTCCDSARRYEFHIVRGAASSAQAFVVDAFAIDAPNKRRALSAQQLERLLHRTPNIVDASLLPILTRNRQTLAAFVAQTERRITHKNNGAVRAGSASDSLPTHSESLAANDRNVCQESAFSNVPDRVLGHFARRLLALVDELAPSDAIGILLRPYDLQSTALIEQECPYMLHNVAAFVPALSRFCERL